MLLSRTLSPHIQELIRYFPIVSLTGPRQAGKTTLLRFLFPDYKYVSLENPDDRAFAQQDPNSFLEKYAEKVIFDEAQRVPDLFSYLQTKVDMSGQKGQFILSGSQNFLLRKNITQSLAGRVGMVRLFPFSYQELVRSEVPPVSMEETIYRGFYPALFDTGIPPALYYPNYIETYLQRDVSSLITPKNMGQFQRFLRLCAGHVGQLVNYNSLANKVGVSLPTAKNWLSILEQSYIIFQLSPYFRNFNKRIVKTPKLYFYDTGLACHLLQMRSAADVDVYYQKGALFENMVVAELFKQAYHRNQRPNFYFWQDSNRNEIDLLWEELPALKLLEIKASRTLMPRSFKNLQKMSVALGEQPHELNLVYGGDEDQIRQGGNVNVVSWRHLGQLKI
ncbi:MAG TPA: ATP-binding protein [Bacteroidetes bacterium]|nr:ATP-binding protein [Bacteroidota bacterium]